jgi:hypothetical protein
MMPNGIAKPGIAGRRTQFNKQTSRIPGLTAITREEAIPGLAAQAVLPEAEKMMPNGIAKH